MMSFLKHSIFLFLMLLLAQGKVYAQKKKIENLPKFDKKTIHFGFLLGVTQASYTMDHDITKVDSLLKIDIEKQSGFHLGIISDLHLTPLVSLRFLPALVFTQRNLNYVFLEPDSSKSTIKKPVESTYLVFPLNLKYRSSRYNNFAPYVLGGANYSLDLASQHRTDNEGQPLSEIVIKTKRSSYNVEVGVGFDMFLEYFKFSPEIKMTWGINNIMIRDNTIFSDPIYRLYPKMLWLSFNFEG